MDAKREAQPAPEPVETVPKKEKKLSRVARKVGAGALAMFLVANLQGDAPPPTETLMQHDEESPHDEDTLTIMTANVRFWTKQDGTGKNIPKFMETVENTGADVVCAQEFVDEGSVIEDIHKEGYDVFFSETVHWWWLGRDPIGNAIISKPSLDNAETVNLPNPETMSPRNAIIAEISTKKGTLSVANTHLSSHEGAKVEQSRLLYPHIKDINVLCGDLKQTGNQLQAGPLSDLIDPVFLETYLPTFPDRQDPNIPPRRDVDHIVSSCAVPVPDTLRRKTIHSDHFARVVDIDISGCFENEQNSASG